MRISKMEDALFRERKRIKMKTKKKKKKKKKTQMNGSNRRQSETISRKKLFIVFKTASKILLFLYFFAEKYFVKGR